MIVQAVAAGEVDNVNLPSDLMEDRDLCVREETSLAVISPDLVDQSCLAGVLQTDKPYEALRGENVSDFVNYFNAFDSPENVFFEFSVIFSISLPLKFSLSFSLSNMKSKAFSML